MKLPRFLPIVFMLATAVSIQGQFFTLSGDFSYSLNSTRQVFDLSPDGKLGVTLTNQLTSFDPIFGTVLDSKTVGFGPLGVQMVQTTNGLRVMVLTSQGGPRAIYLFDLDPTGKLTQLANTQPAGVGLVIQIDNEQMIVTGNVSNTLTVTRAANSTTAAAHNSGAGVNPPFDQRGAGFPRIVNGRSDIGAYESHNLQVNSLADTDDGACTDVGTGNGCTLREAINAANAQTGTESISFAPALTSGGPAAITLLSALPNLSSDMMIAGPGANLLTVQRSTAGGTPNFRIFIINPGKTITISALTISNGNVTTGSPNTLGGGIYNNQGNLTINNCVISGNSALSGGGIFNDAFTSTASMTITNSTITGNLTGTAGSVGGTGGGIANTGTLGLNNSSVSGNQTGNGIGSGGGDASAGGAGGGIDNSGTLTLTDSTVSGNRTGDGSGASHGGYGGGISNSGTATLTNSTISGNQTGGPNGTPGVGGGIYSRGPSTLTNCTITDNQTGNSGNSGFIGYGNGGGILNEAGMGATNIKNTIVAGNRIAASASGPDLSGTFNSQDYNLVGNTSGASFTGTTAHNITNANALLGSLADNGGPTLTHALLTGSPAIDAGNNLAVTNPPFIGPPFTDQRAGSFNRIADGDGNSTAIVDIGAYELQGILTVDKVNPPAGRTSGGQQIRLAGAFANLSTVTMGGLSASWVYTNGGGDTSAITITTPAHAVGAVQIDLTPTSGSGYSKPNAFAYLPTVFTDDTLVIGVTTAKAQHVIELRQAVDAMRAVAGLSGAPWTDGTLTPASSVIKAIHIQELRTYLDDAATRLGYATSPYTDPSLSTGYLIKRIHIEELRQRIRIIAG